MIEHLSSIARERVTKFPEPTQQYGLSIVLRKKYPRVAPAHEQEKNRVEWSTIPSSLTELLQKRVQSDTLLASHVLQSPPVRHIEFAGKCSTILEHLPGVATTLIDLAPGATVTIREQNEKDAVNSSQLFLLNVGEGATVQWFGASLASQGITNRWALATLAKNAVCTIHSALIHLPIVHEELHADLLAPGATFRARSLIVGTKDDQFDLHLSADHRAPSAVSNLRSKGVLGGKAQAVMRGNIRVRENGKGTDGYQRCDGLLLSRGSEMDPVPNLEIETNDVRCTHGVAISHVHPEQRFYLQSRGLSQELADQLLISGFSSEIIGMYPEDMRSALEEACASALKEIA